MSRGFVKEYDDMRLNEVPPSLNGLIRYLTYESNGFTVYEKKSYKHPETGREMHEMSNGLTYALNDDREWYIVE